jgi:2-isopropylmalate synthase
VIRVNSQSGKGGVAYIMETEHGMVLPRRLQIEFSRAVQHATEDTGTEISPAEMWQVFSREYLPEYAPIELVAHETATAGDRATVVAHLRVRDDDVTVTGEGNGPIAAFVNALRDGLAIAFDVVDYVEHAVGAGADAAAVAYVETTDRKGHTRWGVGRDASILTAGLQAVVSALNGRERNE